jgi:hypothetical protein
MFGIFHSHFRGDGGFNGIISLSSRACLARYAHGRVGAALESQLFLLPLNTMVHDTPPHTFCDYFQMSETLASRECCVEIDMAIQQNYEGGYL